MPDLYTLKEKNVFRTYLFLTLFLIVVAGLGYILSFYLGESIVFWGVFGLSIAMSFISYWFSDRIVLKMTGAKPVKRKEFLELHRIVENLAITAGLPKPKIYIIEDRAPNSFATGRNPGHSAVIVTRGLVDKLDRNELEGVIAHELSHIGNRDTLIATVVVILVGVVIRATDLALRVGFGGRDRKERGRGGIGLLLSLIFLLIAPVFAYLLKFAISRKREFVADASAGLLTRYPEGLASALEKLGQNKTTLKRASNATAHLFIENPFRDRRSKSFLVKLFSTHPPLEERIKVLRSMEI